MHGHLYIILKESIKYIPILGTGMMFYGFIFLSRKWATDKRTLPLPTAQTVDLPLRAAVRLQGPRPHVASAVPRGHESQFEREGCK
jgi:1-acyl-sn-glycerol-3-phosphate acyltransferase